MDAPLKEILEKVVLALKGMGFRDVEARRAVREVERKHPGTEPLTIEQALREALVAATAASAA
jgi:Holliday junction resolvasome RuvABC DNA-binding subunit